MSAYEQIMLAAPRALLNPSKTHQRKNTKKEGKKDPQYPAIGGLDWIEVSSSSIIPSINGDGKPEKLLWHPASCGPMLSRYKWSHHRPHRDNSSPSPSEALVWWSDGSRQVPNRRRQGGALRQLFGQGTCTSWAARQCWQSPHHVSAAAA